MQSQFQVHIDAWADGTAIPARFAFGRPGTDSPFAPSDNVSPAIRWSNAPAGTQSLAIICKDLDVPSSGEDVNQEGKTVPADLPRVPFFHWVLVDIPVDVSGLEEGAASRRRLFWSRCLAGNGGTHPHQRVAYGYVLNEPCCSGVGFSSYGSPAVVLLW